MCVCVCVCVCVCPNPTHLIDPALRLFQVVVDSDHTASRIMACMNKEKLPGEITFLPLSILKPPSVHYPETEVQEGEGGGQGRVGGREGGRKGGREREGGGQGRVGGREWAG